MANNLKKNKKLPPQQPASKKEIGLDLLIGFGVTIICNLAGMYFVSEFSEMETIDFFRESIRNKSFSSIVALGALMDFLAFFVFLKKGQYYRLRGVLLGVITAALVVAYFKFYG